MGTNKRRRACRAGGGFRNLKISHLCFILRCRIEMQINEHGKKIISFLTLKS